MRARQPRSGISLGSLLAASVLALALPAALPFGVSAQTAAPAGKADDAKEAAPKQIALSQQKVDGLIAVQKKVREMESKKDPKGTAPKQADAQAGKDLDGIVKANGFASLSDFADTNFSIGMVLSGMDPDGGDYIGTTAALQKEQAQVKADKKMPANEKKEALEEIEAAMKSAPTEKPLPGNIALVKSNLAKLSEGLQGD